MIARLEFGECVSQPDVVLSFEANDRFHETVVDRGFRYSGVSLIFYADQDSDRIVDCTLQVTLIATNPVESSE